MPRENENEIIVYTTQDGKETFEVNLKEETVWLSQRQMAELFEKDVRTINEHIGNIYKEKELSKSSTIRNFRIVQKEGNRLVERKRSCYNLDVIISVGYRVKSQRGTQFRIWATNILKNHLIQGYTINQKRLQENQAKIKELQKTSKLIPITRHNYMRLLRNFITYSDKERYLSCDKEKILIAS